MGHPSIALILSVALLGCLGEVPPDPDLEAPATPDLDFPSFGTPIEIGVGPIEASFTVGSDGSMLACAHGGFSIPSPLYASIDGGLTWTPQTYYDAPVPGGDCDVAITDDGSWVYVFTNLPSVFVSVSHDQGKTWTQTYNTVAPFFPPIDRPWLRAVGNTVYFTYKSVNVEPFIVAFTKSTDSGRTWSPPRMVYTSTNPDIPNGNMGKMIVSADGQTIRAPLHRFDSASEENPRPEWFEFLTSHDGGAIWTTEKILGPLRTRNDAFMPEAAQSKDGAIFVTLAFPEGPGAVATTYSLDNAKTWSDPVFLAKDRDLGGEFASWIDPDPDGGALATWLSIDEGHWRLEAAMLHIVDGQLVVDVRDVATGMGDRGALYEFPMLEHDDEGRAHILFPAPGCGGDCLKIIHQLAQ